jgi:hypothetical protein
MISMQLPVPASVSGGSPAAWVAWTRNRPAPAAADASAMPSIATRSGWLVALGATFAAPRRHVADERTRSGGDVLRSAWLPRASARRPRKADQARWRTRLTSAGSWP